MISSRIVFEPRHESKNFTTKNSNDFSFSQIPLFIALNYHFQSKCVVFHMHLFSGSKGSILWFSWAILMIYHSKETLCELFWIIFESQEESLTLSHTHVKYVMVNCGGWFSKLQTHSVWYSWKGVNCNSRFRQLSVQESTVTSVGGKDW